jgi:hypothetical protein
LNPCNACADYKCLVDHLNLTSHRQDAKTKLFSIEIPCALGILQINHLANNGAGLT